MKTTFTLRFRERDVRLVTEPKVLAGRLVVHFSMKNRKTLRQFSLNVHQLRLILLDAERQEAALQAVKNS